MDLFTVDNLISLLMLVMLQAVLGFDNLLYIALESQRAPVEKQAMVRKLGIAIAVILRICLLFLLLSVIEYFQSPLFSLNFEGVVEGEFNLHTLIVLLGGVFIMYTATKEILHMIRIEDHQAQDRPSRSAGSVIFAIVAMNVVFSFDSILSAMALTKVFVVMATAILIGGALMIWLADSVTGFLQKNRMYEVLGLFILFIVGIMLLTEGGHLGHIKLFGNPIEQMSKTTFYFIITVLVLIDIVQTRYQRKLLRQAERSAEAASVSTN
ncbi:MAG: tellurium resistance protein TerC [Pseudomonadota bacterium]